MFDTLSNDDLRPEHVPGPDVPWSTIAEFALTYDGYEAMGGLGRLASYTERRFERWNEDGSLPRDLSHLRSCLFMMQRAVRWAFDETPTADELAFTLALLEAIRIAAAKNASSGG